MMYIWLEFGLVAQTPVVCNKKNETQNYRKMTYKEDKNFNKLLNQLKELNINFNQKYVSRLYENLKLYVKLNEDGYLDLTIPSFYSENYYIDLAIRELGSKTIESIDNADEYLSTDISTFVFENYFVESKENTLSYFINELKRISKNNLNCKIISESEYNENNNQTTILFEFSVNNNLYKLTHNDDFEDGTLMASFIIKELLPKLDGALQKGYLLYICEEWIQFIYFENEEDYLKFRKSADYYSEINSKCLDTEVNEKSSLVKENIQLKNEEIEERKQSWWKRLWS